ncbi:hypothetical protein MRB53_008794 [Persea americana]|uniref:Uncharacterized protein n=1 Tax=Persea americana TaxID=3435 RepID=A0ACC2LM49_PERAE|nr:hypothetical protein MRB53_008794 [Persea americana]
MRLSFWRSRDRFSLQELRYLTGQLQKVHIVDDTNKDYVIEALRSMAELVTYGDQHDPTFFEFFMEKQIMGEFVRILKVSRIVSVALQLVQTMSIMIQNLKNEHAIYYIFSNEHINHLITYSFDFRNEELLSYYISFLRAISGKLNKNTISLLVKTKDDEVVSFPLYTEAIRFAFHEENMVRIAVRALTLNVYHVGDTAVNRFVTSTPLSIFFSDLVTHFKKQCFDLHGWVTEASKIPNLSDATSCVLSAVDGIEDTLYYFSDVISSGVPNLGILIADNILQILVFPLLLPSVKREFSDGGAQIGVATSLYLICCILRIVKTKDLASSISAAFFCPPEAFTPKSESKPNGYVSDHDLPHENQQQDPNSLGMQAGMESLRVTVPDLSSSQIHPAEGVLWQQNYSSSHLALREVLLSYVVSGDDIKALGSLTVLSTLLQTKELDESMLDALGILPQRKQHKKLLLQALVGESCGDEQLFSPEGCLAENNISNELEIYLRKLEHQYGWLISCREPGISPRIHRHQVLDALISLLCRSDLSAETLWAGGWLLRQLLPYCQEEFSSHHLKLLKDSHSKCTNRLLGEIRGSWCDLLITVLVDQWKKCKKAIEASSPQKDPKCMLFPSFTSSSEGQSSFAAGEQMHEMVKVYVLCHQLRIFSIGGTLPEEPPVCSPSDLLVNPRAKTAGLDLLTPKPGVEINLVNAVPCRIAFERGKERHFCFLAVSRETSGWVLLAEELPLKQNFGIVRVVAPLPGSNPRIDEKHPKWMHLRIRPWNLPFVDPTKSNTLGRSKPKALVDGRWILAFRDERSCKSAESMILEELNLQCSEVEKRLKPLFDLSRPVHTQDLSTPAKEVLSET